MPRRSNLRLSTGDLARMKVQMDDLKKQMIELKEKVSSATYEVEMLKKGKDNHSAVVNIVVEPKEVDNEQENCEAKIVMDLVPLPSVEEGLAFVEYHTIGKKIDANFISFASSLLREEYFKTRQPIPFSDMTKLIKGVIDLYLFTLQPQLESKPSTKFYSITTDREALFSFGKDNIANEMFRVLIRGIAYLIRCILGSFTK
ncbi:uncharacterized protein LOC119689845 [Teleopsis dalmanni]|uniref:uncharacterized protein LOC119689845 n=1 Tax=Teleopsis dalmanni TaxID=139649 RepID=UPI0018CDE4B2|nr:uncharacterized protein LOC119689845 [Teleopsis dalmanni]